MFTRKPLCESIFHVIEKGTWALIQGSEERLLHLSLFSSLTSSPSLSSSSTCSSSSTYTTKPLLGLHYNHNHHYHQFISIWHHHLFYPTIISSDYHDHHLNHQSITMIQMILMVWRSLEKESTTPLSYHKATSKTTIILAIIMNWQL